MAIALCAGFFAVIAGQGFAFLMFFSGYSIPDFILLTFFGKIILTTIVYLIFLPFILTVLATKKQMKGGKR